MRFESAGIPINIPAKSPFDPEQSAFIRDVYKAIENSGRPDARKILNHIVTKIALPESKEPGKRKATASEDASPTK